MFPPFQGQPQFETMDRRRVVLFALATAASFGAGVFEAATGVASGTKLLWEFGSSALCLGCAAATRWGRPSPRLLSEWGLVGFLLTWTPVVFLRGREPLDLMMLAVIPLAFMLAFLDHPRLVPSIMAAGWLSNTITFGVAAWPMVAVVRTSMVLGLVYGVGLMMVREFDRLRREAAAQHLDRERHLAQQLQTERLAMIGRLAAGVAHDINNPLAYVKANLEQLRRADYEPGEGDELWSEALDGLGRITEIVADLRTLARPEKGPTVSSAEVTEVVGEVLRISRLRAGAGVRVRSEVPAGLPPVAIEGRRLVQVLLNLVINACDAVEDARVGGEVVITAAHRGSEVVLDVRDDGPGISPEVLPRLFEGFVTTKPVGKGTGLGLALSREFVEASGGALSGVNLPAGGACFSVRLRVDPAPSAQS